MIKYNKYKYKIKFLLTKFLIYSKIYLTHILEYFECDTYFPNINLSEHKVIYKGELLMVNETAYRIMVYERRI